jgi:hypothetical protein
MIHGDVDRTVPARSSMEFWMELKALQLGSTVKLRVVPGMAHHVPVVGELFFSLLISFVQLRRYFTNTSCVVSPS